MPAIDLVTFQSGLDEIFPSYAEQLPLVSRLWDPITKRYNQRGLDFKWRPLYGAARGGKVFGTSRANIGGPRVALASFNYKRDYVHLGLDIEALEASQGDGAPESLQEVEVRAALAEHALTWKLEVLGNGGMARGRIASGQGTTTIVLTDPEDTIYFYPGMKVQVSAGTDGSASGAADTDLRDNGEAVEVLAVSRQAGTVTKTGAGAWNVDIAGCAANDYLFRESDYARGFLGLRRWLPDAAPTAGDSHGGFDRSIWPERFAGLRVSVAGELLDAIIKVCSEMLANGNPSLDGYTVLLSDTDCGTLIRTVQSGKRYSNNDGSARFGASSMTFETPWGNLKVVGETALGKQSNGNRRFIVGELSEIELLARLGDVPHFADQDGRKWRHLGGSDSIEAYLQSYCGLRINKPSKFAVGLF